MIFTTYQTKIQDVISDQGIKAPVALLDPPSPDLGEFCFVVNRIAGKNDPKDLANTLLPLLRKIEGIHSVDIFDTSAEKRKGIVYLNFKLEEETKSKIQTDFLDQVFENVYNQNYGYLEDKKNQVVIVEHTSANPISPLHVGNLRNSVQGDTFARILERYGYTVYRHFYVNDVGLQVSYVLIGYEILKLSKKSSPIKFDVWMGQVYAIMHNFFTIQSLKLEYSNLALSKDLYNLSDKDTDLIFKFLKNDEDKLSKELNELEEIDKPSKNQKTLIRDTSKLLNGILEKQSTVSKAKSSRLILRQRFSQLYDILYDGVAKLNLVTSTADYLRKYEKHTEKEITSLFREMVDWVLACFVWTLRRYNIEFDSFDYESDVTKSKLHLQVIDELKTKSNAHVGDEGSVKYSFPKSLVKEFCKNTGISEKSLPVKGNIPDLQLKRSDGTTLYAAKDIAYSIRKFEDRHPVAIYNVISSEQVLPQYQMVLAIYDYGHVELAKAITHYSYELVELRGRPMSGRLAQYILADEFLDETYIRARMAKREADEQRSIPLPETAEQWDRENQSLNAVTLASTRFPLIETSPKRKIQLDLDRELDFKRNSGPFVQYAHARANGVIRKVASEFGENPSNDCNTSLLADDEILSIASHLNSLDDSIRQSSEAQDPSIIATWCFSLAQSFMKFYEKFPVLRAESPELRLARLSFIEAIRRGLATGLKILGIPPAASL